MKMGRERAVEDTDILPLKEENTTQGLRDPYYSLITFCRILQPLLLVCVASAFAWVRRESWDESKKEEWEGVGGERRKILPAKPTILIVQILYDLEI